MYNHRCMFLLITSAVFALSIGCGKLDSFLDNQSNNALTESASARGAHHHRRLELQDMFVEGKVINVLPDPDTDKAEFASSEWIFIKMTNLRSDPHRNGDRVGLSICVKKRPRSLCSLYPFAEWQASVEPGALRVGNLIRVQGKKPPSTATCKRCPFRPITITKIKQPQ